MIELDPTGLKENPIEWFNQKYLSVENIGEEAIVIQTANIHYAVEIDVSDSSDLTESPQIGLFNDADLNDGNGGNVFRWVTERPDFDGTTIVPTGDLTTVNAIKWGEGLFTGRQNLGTPVRLININVAGNYGSLSGFNFSVDNIKVESGTYVNQRLIDILNDNNIYLLNRRIRFYAVINNVFYNIWSGLVGSLSQTETEIALKCEDDFKTIHNVIPPQIANDTLFPDLIKKSIGKPIPVTLGFNQYARVLNVKTKEQAIDLYIGQGQTRKLAPIINTSSTSDGSGNFLNSGYVVFIGDAIFERDELKGKFIRVVLEGGSEDFYKIINTNSTTASNQFNGNKITLNVDTKIDPTDLVFFTRPNFTVLTKGSWVQVFDFESTYIVSNNKINDLPSSKLGYNTEINFFDSSTKNFVDVSEAGEENSETDINSTSFPGITGFTNVGGNSGEFLKFLSIKPASVTLGDIFLQNFGSIVSSDFGNKGDQLPNLLDQSRDPISGVYATKNTIVYSESADSGIFGTPVNAIHFKVEIPKELFSADLKEFYVLIDYDITASETDANDISLTKVITAEPVSIDDFDQFGMKSATFHQGKFVQNVTQEQRMIPPGYYNEKGENTSLFADLRAEINLADFYDSEEAFKAYPYIKVSLAYFNEPAIFPNEFTIDVFQISFGALKKIKISEDNLFLKTDGEKTDNTNEPTTNVYNSFLKVLETYDGLNASNEIDLTAIVSRKNWTSGRQLISRKSSFDYLKELAQQSFIGLFPSRNGKRVLSAFREKDTITRTFGANLGNIVAKSLSPVVLTPINQVYNEFEVQYQYIDADRRYEKSVFVKKVSESTFPDQFVSSKPADDSTETGFTSIAISIFGGSTTASIVYGSLPASFVVGGFVSLDDSNGIGQFSFGDIISIDATTAVVNFVNTYGLTDGDSTATGTIHIQGSRVQQWKTFVGGFGHYKTAVELWNVCHNSYLKTLVVNRLPDTYSKCKWFVDETNFGLNEGDDSTAHKYLKLLVEWCTRQKEKVSFKVPMTIEFVQLELLEFATFVDQKLTNGVPRTGYITKIKPAPSSDQIVVELTLVPDDIESVTDGIITETGTQPDTITESGSQPDTITEGV